MRLYFDENGKVTPIPDEVNIIRCKECKHRPNENYEFPEGSKCPCHCSGDEYYSWIPDDNWFCANGEMKDNG